VIRHIVLFEFQPGTTETQIDDYERSLIEYVSGLDGVMTYRVGRDAGLNPNTYDYAIVAEFEDEAHFRAYFDGDRHLEIQRETASMIAGKASSQSRFD
jgi:heme-degrading monooxygenase HmoA